MDVSVAALAYSPHLCHSRLTSKCGSFRSLKDGEEKYGIKGRTRIQKYEERAHRMEGQ